MNEEALCEALLWHQERALTHAVRHNRIASRILSRLGRSMDLAFENRELLASHGLFDLVLEDCQELIELAEQQIETNLAVTTSNRQFVREVQAAA